VTTRALVCALAIAACSHDIRLGSELDAGTDAAPDAVSSPFTAGNYTVSFLDPPRASCTGTLAGREADFASITRANSQLVDGAVAFTLATNQLTIAGAPIQTAFRQTSVTVVPDATASPPTIWDTSVPGPGTTGPDSTTVTSLALAADSATAQAPTGIEGAYAELFVTADTNGQCAISFGAQFVRN
jgi:hypothetical protein